MLVTETANLYKTKTMANIKNILAQFPGSSPIEGNSNKHKKKQVYKQVL